MLHQRGRLRAAAAPLLLVAQANCSKGPAVAADGGAPGRAASASVGADARSAATDDATTTTPPSDTEVASPSAFPDATIRLLESGRPPRRRLRYAWQVGQA